MYSYLFLHKSGSKNGFTLIELMIVIAILAILASFSIFPYNFYMDRVRVENLVDIVGQEWVLAHNDVKNGLLFDENHNAHLYISLKKGSKSIDILKSTGGDSEKKIYKKVNFEGSQEILDLSGTTLGDDNTILYHISPPFATGAYSTGSTESFLSGGIIMTVGYSGSTLESRKVRNILLRPYYE